MTTALPQSRAFSSAFGVTVNAAKPPGTVSGSLLTAHISCNTSTTFGALPSGWTIVGSTSSNGIWAYKVAGGSEPSTYAFTQGNGLASIYAEITRWDGHDPASPIDVGVNLTSSGANVTTTSITTTVAGATLAASLALTSSTSAVTVPSGMTQYTNDGTTIRTATAYQVLGAAGATGSRQWTNPSTTVAHALVAIKPAPRPPFIGWGIPIA